MPATPAEYVRSHWELLNAYSRSRRFRPHYVEPDEFRQALVLSVLEKHEQFHENDGGACHCGATGCSTWLGWRARRVATDYHRQRQRAQERQATEVPVEEAALLPSQHGSHSGTERSARVAQVLRHADDKEHAACLTVLDDCDGIQVHERLGIQIHGRNYRLRKLAQKIAGDR